MSIHDSPCIYSALRQIYHSMFCSPWTRNPLQIKILPYMYIRTRIGNYIINVLWDEITHPCSNFNDSIVKPPLQVRHGWCIYVPLFISSPRGLNGRHFRDDIFKSISLNENIWISNKISFKYVPWGVIDNMSVLVQIMAWRRPGDKPLSEPMLTQTPTQICGIRGRWVNTVM